jgi:hypothetical protein
MEASHGKGTRPIGFLTVRHRAPHGYFGGFLVINELARPMEFHCTLPLMPSRAQQILFGATLDEFLCGEQIARALLSKAKVQPKLVLTDTPAVLAVRHWIDAPIFWLERSEFESSEKETGFAIPNHARDASEYSTRSLQDATVRWWQSYASDSKALDLLLDGTAASLDLNEPFGRIVEALAEAHPRSKAA